MKNTWSLLIAMCFRRTAACHCKWWKKGSLTLDRKWQHQMWVGMVHNTPGKLRQRDVWGVYICVRMCCIFLLISVLLSAVFCVYLVLLLCLPSIMLKMFPNISSVLEQILFLRINVTAELTVLFFKDILHLVKSAGN